MGHETRIYISILSFTLDGIARFLPIDKILPEPTSGVSDTPQHYSRRRRGKSAIQEDCWHVRHSAVTVLVGTL
jgi:hypothetical protein